MCPVDFFIRSSVHQDQLHDSIVWYQYYGKGNLISFFQHSNMLSNKIIIILDIFNLEITNLVQKATLSCCILVHELAEKVC